MGDRNFGLNGRQFKLGKVDIWDQLKIVKRIFPLFLAGIPVAKKLSEGDQNIEDQLSSLSPVASLLGKLPDTDFEMVFKLLLASVEIQQEAGNWARICNGGVLMFHDLELPVLMQISYKAFSYNLSGFLAVLPQVSGTRG